MNVRRCGGCTLCCKLLPVVSPSVTKVAGVRCEHQRATGCKIYADRPMPCRVWHCSWILNDDTDDLSRPDRAHYVIDMQPDYVTAIPHDGGEPIKIPVVQVWVDPAHPDAHRDPALRRFLERRSRKGIAALIRYNSTEGFALQPPSMSPDGQWHEVVNSVGDREHSPAEIAEALAAARR